MAYAATLVIGICGLALACAGCERTPTNTTPTVTTGSPAAAIPPGLFVAAAPSGAKEVAAAKADAKEGETIIVHGRIGGSRDPFVEGRAMFTLADMSMPVCSENPEDGCRTPWDYCCEPKEKITKLTATVQVVDSEGKPIKTSLDGVSSLKPMAEVIVKGRVAQKQDDQVLVIEAGEIFVKKS